jgi:ATP-dependent Clp protease ATP-binding subunit ClpC
LAIDQARAESSPNVGTGHLLAGMVSEGENLALHVLRAIEIDPAQVQRDLTRQAGTETGGFDEAASQHFSTAAAGALELAVTEATSLGHNYIGCEHLLLGLVGEPAGSAGQVLRALGAEARLTRRAVTAALAGYVHLRAQTSAAPATDPMQALTSALQQHLQPLVERIERLEQHLSTAGGDQ